MKTFSVRKKTMAFLLAVMMLLGSINCLFTITAIAEELNESANYTFDEESTEYWSVTTSADTTTFGLEDGGNGGNSLVATYTQGDKALITFDFTLKNNTKYFISYKYKGSDWDVQLMNSGSRIACGEEGTLNYNSVGAFLGTTAEYEPMHIEWKTRTVLFDTGDNVDENINKLAFFLSFDKTTGKKLYIDDISINKVSQVDSYSTDFSEGLDNSDIFNYNPLTSIEVTADPADASNSVLKLHKEYNKAAPYNLYVPIKLTAGDKYTFTYKFKTTSAVQVGLSKGAKVGLLNSNGFENPKAELFSETQFTDILGGFTGDTYNASEWPKIAANCSWINRTESFEVTDEMVEAGASAVGISLSLYGTDPVDALDVYIDDVKVIKHNKITLNTNGGELANTEIFAIAGAEVTLPTPSKDGYTFAGWYTNEALTVVADNIMPSVDTTYYAKWESGEITSAKFTFDEDNTGYWSAGLTENSTDNSVDMDFAVTEGGYSGNALSTAFGLYDKALVTFDYALKNNTKYVISYQYKASKGNATMSHNSSKIAVGKKGTTEYTALAPFTTATGWETIGTSWVTRTVIVETGADIVSSNKNLFALYLSFGTDATFYIDNVMISEVGANASYENDFSGTTKDLDIVNYNPATNLEIVIDPINTENQVLKLARPASANALYSLYIPVNMVDGGIYTISFKYRTDATEQVSLRTNSKIGLIDANANLVTDLGYVVQNAVYYGGWGKINSGERWETRTITYTATEADLANTTGNLVINLEIYNQPASALNVYIDDISVIKHSTVTFNANGGTVDPESITALKGTTFELPTPSLNGAIFKGWFTDADLTVAATNVMPAVDTTYYAKFDVVQQTKSQTVFTFDEADTNYYTYNYYQDSANVGKEYSCSVEALQETNNALAISYILYDKVLISFDYNLKANKKYAISYRYKASNSSATLRDTSCCVAAAGNGEYINLGSFSQKTTNWNSIGTNWNDKIVIIDTTDADISKYNNLAFYLHFGNSATLHIDDVKITELTDECANYYNDFSDSNKEFGIVNIEPSTYPTITTDPTDAENEVLWLKKPKTTSSPKFKLLIPVKVVPGYTYSVSYKYKSDAPEKQGVNRNDYIGLCGADGEIVTSIDYVIANSKHYGGWGRIPGANKWESTSIVFNATEENTANTTGYMVLSFSLLYYEPENATNVYFDDFKVNVYKSNTITLDTNGGVVESNVIYGASGSEITLPTPEKSGFFFVGWYSDKELTKVAGDKMPENPVTYYAKWISAQEAIGINIAKYATVTGTDVHSSYPYSNLVDENFTTRWASKTYDANELPIYAQLEWESEVSFDTFVIREWKSSTGYRAKGFKLSVSKDGNEFTDIYSNDGGIGAECKVELDSKVTGKFLRLTLLSVLESQTEVPSLLEFEVYRTLDDNNIYSFDIAGGITKIDNTNNTINVKVIPGIDKTSLKPVIGIADGATYSPTGAQDFTNPITYTVTARDGKTQKNYTVKLEETTYLFDENLEINSSNDVSTFGPTPSVYQYNYHKQELAAFLHFSMNTFTGAEWGTGSESPSQFTLTDSIDADGYVKTLKDAGFKKLIITSKHHDGFCIWRSQYTDHDLESTGYKGDVLEEISVACTKYGLEMGLYLSPWDMHDESYGYYDENHNPVDESMDVLDYNDYYANQLEEILSNNKYGNNGHFTEIWLDGAKGSGADAQEYDFKRYVDIIFKNEGKAAGYEDNPLLFGVWGYYTIRWIGNEDGIAPEENWAKTNANFDLDGNLVSINSTDAVKNGNFWIVPEADARITSGWFWGENKRTPKSLHELRDMYLNTVGHNATLLLNVPLNSKGTLDTAIKERVLEFGNNVNESFKENNLILDEDVKIAASEVLNNDKKFSPSNMTDRNDNTYWTAEEDTKQSSILINFGKTVTFDSVTIEEAIKFGQRVEAFSVSYKNTKGKWVKFSEGTTIGAKRVILGRPVQATELLITLTGMTDNGINATPVISEIGVYKATDEFAITKAAPNGIDEIDDLSDDFSYQNWEIVESVDHIGNSYLKGTAGSVMDIDFEGSIAWLVGDVYESETVLDISIDDETSQRIVLSADSPARSVRIFETGTLDDGKHTIHISVVSGVAGIDGLFVLSNQNRGMLEFEEETYTVDEDAYLELKILRKGGASGTLDAIIQDNPGSAVQSSYYTTDGIPVHFDDGEIEKVIKIRTKRYTETTGTLYFKVEIVPTQSENNLICGFNNPATINIIDAEGYKDGYLKNIKIGNLPVRLKYCIGESLDLSGLQILGTYSTVSGDDAIRELESDQYYLNNVSLSTVGKKTVTVYSKYDNKSVSFEIEVLENGDVNMDGVIDARDIVRLKKELTKTSIPDNCDINKDGIKSALDLSLLRKFILGAIKLEDFIK